MNALVDVPPDLCLGWSLVYRLMITCTQTAQVQLAALPLNGRVNLAVYLSSLCLSHLICKVETVVTPHSLQFRGVTMSLRVKRLIHGTQRRARPSCSTLALKISRAHPAAPTPRDQEGHKRLLGDSEMEASNAVTISPHLWFLCQD